MKATLFILSFFLIGYIFGQDPKVKIDYEKFRKEEQGFKEAWAALRSADLLWIEACEFRSKGLTKYQDAVYKNTNVNLREGDAYFSSCKENLRKALKKLLFASAYNSSVPELNYVIGVCYLASEQKDKAFDYLQKAYDANNKLTSDIKFQMGRVNQLQSKFDKALELYKAYKSELSVLEAQSVDEILKKYVEECNSGIDLLKKNVNVKIENLGSSINSAFSDYGPLVPSDESVLIYTSRKVGGTSDILNNDGLCYEDIYISKKENNVWKASENLGKTVNSLENDAAIGLSADGKTLLIYKSEFFGDIFQSNLNGSTWSKPVPLKGINTDFNESYACLTSNGSKIYFVSNRDIDEFGTKSLGRKDIFVAEKQSDGLWAKVKNLGSVINTSFDENAVFISTDEKTLYFSSRGHNTMGDYDIFKSTLNDKGEWGSPVNIGSPINTPYDDRCFTTVNKDIAYYSSSKEGGLGFYDIYKVQFIEIVKPVEVKPVEKAPVVEEKPVVVVKEEGKVTLNGIISDAVSNIPIEATIEITDNAKNAIIQSVKSSKKTGRFTFTLPIQGNFGIAVKADYYLFYSENFNLNEIEARIIEKAIKLEKVDIGGKIVLRNVFFESGKTTLQPASYAEIESLQKMMSEFPTLKIEISGHTDNKGSKALNQSISENRAKAVVDYMVSKGADKKRLVFKGYADEQPVGSNDTDEGRQLNRRVEVKILSK